MKRMIAFGLAAGLVIVVFGGVSLKPIIEKTHRWDLTGKSYCRVKLANGSTVELKSAKPLTTEQWKKRAEDYQKIIDAIVEPAICPTCGGTGYLP